MQKKVKMKFLSHVWLFATLWTVAWQAPPSMAFYRQEYWSGLPFPSPVDPPEPVDQTRQTVNHLSHQGSLKYEKVELVRNVQEFYN